MNIFRRELRAYRTGLLFWCVGMIALVASGMAKYAAYQTTGQSIVDLIEKFPRGIQIIFGMVGLNLSTASGFYGLLFVSIALMATLHAVLLGSDIMAKEERDRTSEFLFAKPVPRSRIVTDKLLAGLINLLCFTAVTAIASILLVQLVNKGASATTYILLLMGGLCLLQLLFFFVGTMMAAVSRKPKIAASRATAVLLGTFILAYVIDFNAKLDFLKFLTPFKYFDARIVLQTGRLNLAFALFSIATTVVLAGMTYRGYCKRDLNV